ncbi:MAG: RHS repeat-associated core domain-containing protein [Dehalococcoidia bacterium]|nr:RHS repeat-associated core domain-containing protein [Dehalococcoidia bacterium]
MAAATRTLHESVTDWNSNSTTYSYDDAGRMTSTTLPSGTGIVSSYVDGLGSTMAVVDSSGNSQKSYTYDVYGEATASGGLSNEFDFAGQQTDGTGLQYLRARYFDPETGTFLSREPMAVGPRWTHSNHGYANARPASMIDPSGTVAIDTEGCEVGNVGCHERAGGYMGCTWTTPQSCDLAAGIYPRGFDEVGGWLREYQGEWQYCHSRSLSGVESYVANPDCDFVTGDAGFADLPWSTYAAVLREWWRYSHGCRGDLQCELNGRSAREQLGDWDVWKCAGDTTCSARVAQWIELSQIPILGLLWAEVSCRRQGGC